MIEASILCFRGTTDVLQELSHAELRRIREALLDPAHAAPTDEAGSPDRVELDRVEIVERLLGPALCLLAEVVRRLQRVRGETFVPLNAWLHDGPHWHLELFPRTTRLAGLELGAGVYINPVSPDQAAAELGSY